MTLLENYQYLGTTDGKEFTNKIAAALYKSATDLLLDAGATPTNADYIFINACLHATAKNVVHIANAMVSQGLDNQTSDTAVQTSINDNFQKLALLYDPTLEG